MGTGELTLMAVHAHPDDEASSTGGTLARYASEGIRTVLVTCTNGELGDDPAGAEPGAEGRESGGAKPGEDGHDEQRLVDLRRRELLESCSLLGIGNLEMLGYRDSGMMGWDSNDDPGAFWNVPVADAAARLAPLMDRYRPDVVLTYDDFGFYGHPDHIQAHRVTLASLDALDLPVKLYFPTIRRSRIADFREKMAEAGIDPPAFDEDRFGSPDEEIAATIDCREHAAAKLAALRAHASQVENIFFTRFDLPTFTEIFSVEEYVRVRDHTGSSLPETDLFAGLR